jgi:CubicO group peptidase (beta-lactamase class C family)
VIEVVTGAPAEDFLRVRLLEPLGMTSTACLLRRAIRCVRACAAPTSASPHAWTRFFGPKEPALFAVFLGSQALYSTTEDYARFLDLWMRTGAAAASGSCARARCAAR